MRGAAAHFVLLLLSTARPVETIHTPVNEERLWRSLCPQHRAFLLPLAFLLPIGLLVTVDLLVTIGLLVTVGLLITVGLLVTVER